MSICDKIIENRGFIMFLALSIGFVVILGVFAVYVFRKEEAGQNAQGLHDILANIRKEEVAFIVSDDITIKMTDTEFIDHDKSKQYKGISNVLEVIGGNIGGGSFKEFNMKKVILDAIINIGHSAFYMCPCLTAAEIKAVSIGNAAFRYSSKLESVEIRGTSTINESAFRNCESAFRNCESLSKVTLINVNLSGIKMGAFYQCPKLEKIVVQDNDRATRVLIKSEEKSIHFLDNFIENESVEGGLAIGK